MRFPILCTTWTLVACLAAPVVDAEAGGLRVGAAAVELNADDSMPIAGGIHPGFVKGQEGKLRAVALVIEGPKGTKVALVACDVLMMTRALLDPVAAETETICAIPAAHVMIAATHTHHAPSTIRVHGYDADPTFSKQLQRAIVEAVRKADADRGPATCLFRLGEEKTVGRNSRLLLGDGTIYWIGPRDDAVRPTGPFDPDLPVLAFRDAQSRLKAMLFSHATHTIGGHKGGVRSPAFYGLAAQQIEAQLGGTAAFFEGASGSTHRLEVHPVEATKRIKQAVLAALEKAEPQTVARLAAVKKPFEFHVRKFDEEAEDRAVSEYCNKRAAGHAQPIIDVFRQMRKELASYQGEARTTWLQAIAVGEVAIVGVPAEFFTKLGIDIKRRSPFKHTIVVELANDWIGYTPDREAHKLGGYQVWTGHHSYAAPGTGERLVDEAANILNDLAP